MEINLFCMALSWDAWLASMALIIFVNSSKGSLEELLLSVAINLSLYYCRFEVFPLLKLGRLDFLEAFIFLFILIGILCASIRLVPHIAIEGLYVVDEDGSIWRLDISMEDCN